MLPVSSGFVKVAGADPSISIDIVRRNIGVCPQHDCLWPQLTVAEHLLLFSRIRGKGWDGGWAAARSETESAMRDVGLQHAANLRTIECSGGMRRRLSVAISSLGNPSVLLLDEPTNDLDVDTLRALEDALEAFPGCAVVISHDRWFLDRIATHVLAFEGDSQVRWFEGNFSEYESWRKKEMGSAADQPHRIKYKPLSR